MFKHIVCGIDFSDSSLSALGHADALAAQFDARLTIVAVNELLLAQASAVAYDVGYLESETDRELRGFAARALGPRTDAVERVVSTGRPADAILSAAETRGADLVVLGTHGLGGVKKMFFGSVTESILRHAAIPVYVTPPSADAAAKPRVVGGMVLVPVDFSQHTERDVMTAAEFARATDASGLTVLHVAARLQAPLIFAEQLHAHHQMMETEATTKMAALASRLDKSLGVNQMVRVGQPAEVIAAVAREKQATAVVIGLGGSRAPGHPPGSTAYRVLSSAAAPVLALPPYRA